MGRRLPSRDPKIALRAFLKDFEPVAYKACIDGARGEMQDNAAPGAFPSATSRSSSVGFKADSRSDVTLPARQLQMSSVSIQNFKALSEISFAFPELSVVRYFETEGCLT